MATSGAEPWDYEGGSGVDPGALLLVLILMASLLWQ